MLTPTDRAPGERGSAASAFGTNLRLDSRDLFQSLHPLWVGGLLLACAIGSALVLHVLGLGGQSRLVEWGVYVAVGALFPAALIAALLLRRRPGSAIGVRSQTANLVGLVVAGGVASLIVARDPGYLLLGVFQAAAFLWFDRARSGRLDPGRAAAALVVSLLAWTAVGRLEYCFSLMGMLATTPRVVLALAAATLLAVAYVARPLAGGWFRSGRGWRWAGLAAGAVVCLLLGFRLDGFALIDDFGPAHNWGVPAGTAGMVGEGGWLLWDVPSQYGFLNGLALAALPTPNPWQAVYLVNGLMMAAAAFLVFLALWAARPDAVGWATALIVGVGAVLLISRCQLGHGTLLPPYLLPSEGPFRFLWAYALLVVAAWATLSAPESRRRALAMAVGCGLWLVGVLWSAESAFYCSATWLPALVLLAWQRHDPRRRPARFGAWLALPVALLAAAVAIIIAVYLVALGRPPDLLGYIEYVASFGRGDVWRLAFDANGPAQSLLLAGAIVGTGAWALLRGRNGLRMAPLLLAAWGALWAVSSYYLSRMDSSIGVRLLPIMALAVAVVLLAMRRQPGVDPSWATVVRLAAAPLLALVVGVTLADPPPVGAYLDAQRRLFAGGGDVSVFLPEVDSSLQQLLTEAGVRADDPIAYAGNTLGNQMPVWEATTPDGPRRVPYSRPWTPAAPITLLGPLPPERRASYVERYLERHPSGGWLIAPKRDGEVANVGIAEIVGIGPWFYNAVERDYLPTRVVENADWQLVWFDPQASRPDLRPLDLPDDGLAALPPDLLVDGRPLAETTEPEFWAFFGDGWSPVLEDLGGRWSDATADLWVFSPDAETVQVRLAPGRGGNAGQVEFDLNLSPIHPAPFFFDGPPGPARALRGAKAATVPLNLEAGWNRVTLRFGAGDEVAGAVDGRVVRSIEIDRGRAKGARGATEEATAGAQSGPAETGGEGKR